MELWKDIEGYEGLYQVSNKGQVRSLVRRNRINRPVRRSDGKEFINIWIAAEESGCLKSHIWEACNGRRKTAGGWGWKYC